MAKKNVIVVHGGSCWATYAEYIEFLKATEFRPDFSPRPGWHKSLQKHLGAGFKVWLLDMPNWQNAKYKDWKIWFEKALAAAGGEPVVVGHSLGGIFLIKYFAETNDAPKIKGMMLVGTPYKTHALDRDFGDFAIKGSLKRINALGQKVRFYHGRNDPIVEFNDFEKYAAALPHAVGKSFKDRGHFVGNQFPELARDIGATFSAA